MSKPTDNDRLDPSQYDPDGVDEQKIALVLNQPKWIAPRPELIEDLAARGLTLKEIAHVLNISTDMLRKHRRLNEALEQAAERGNSKGLERVAGRLFTLATDPTIDSRAQIPAAIFWLKAKGGWRENTPVAPADAGKSGLTDEMMMRRIAKTYLDRADRKQRKSKQAEQSGES